MNTLREALKDLIGQIEQGRECGAIPSNSPSLQSALDNAKQAVAESEGMVLVPIEQFASKMADLQPLGLSQNRGDRLWQLYRTPEECILDIKKAIQTAAIPVKP